MVGATVAAVATPITEVKLPWLPCWSLRTLDLDPIDNGTNRTEAVHVAKDKNTPPQFVANIVNSFPFPPAKSTMLILAEPAPLLVKVNRVGAEDIPTAKLPKSMFGGDDGTLNNVAVPASGTAILPEDETRVKVAI